MAYGVGGHSKGDTETKSMWLERPHIYIYYDLTWMDAFLFCRINTAGLPQLSVLTVGAAAHGGSDLSPTYQPRSVVVACLAVIPHYYCRHSQARRILPEWALGQLEPLGLPCTMASNNVSLNRSEMVVA